ncbi:MAG: DUF4112 domain-containing protein, partial [Arachnia sp.]
FAYLLDDLVRLPGTGVRIGIDPLLSLIPGAGSTVGAVFGSVVLVDAVRLRAPLSVLTRMGANYLTDWLLGFIPLIGAFFDLTYRSNRKNLVLLQRSIADAEQVRRASLRYWIGVALLLAMVIVVVVGVPIAGLLWLDHLVTGS